MRIALSPRHSGTDSQTHLWQNNRRGSLTINNGYAHGTWRRIDFTNMLNYGSALIVFGGVLDPWSVLFQVTFSADHKNASKMQLPDEQLHIQMLEILWFTYPERACLSWPVKFTILSQWLLDSALIIKLGLAIINLNYI